MTMTAAAGPSSTHTSTAPIRCPDVPAATGKLSICAAKTNAAARPINGTRRGGNMASHVAQRDGNSNAGQHRGSRCRLQVDEPVGDVHGAGARMRKT